jgi:hypothetical protein
METLQYLAYPWRCLFLPALFLPLLAGAAAARLPRRWVWAVLTLVVAFNLAHTEPKGYLTFDDEYYGPASIAARGINTSTREEYEPRWVAARPAPASTPLAGLRATVQIISSRRSSSRQEFILRAAGATEVEAATFFYPGWSATIDGTAVPVSISPVRGTIVFPIAGGEHRVTLVLGPTPVRRAARWLTVVTLGFSMLAVAANRVRSARRRPVSPSGKGAAVVRGTR